MPQSPANDSLEQIRTDIVDCTKCPRLIRYCRQIARDKKREFRESEYWGKPVPGFGDPSARLVVVGLAPAAHGANRTGRPFTGDRSANFLVGALHAAGFANQPTSTERHDGLRYQDLFLTAAVRCAPPDNRPTPIERDRCLPYLEREFRLLRNARAFLALGGFAWDATLDVVARRYQVERPRLSFAHGACAVLGESLPLVWASYHPSPQNTNTGKLTPAMLRDLLQRIRDSWN